MNLEIERENVGNKNIQKSKHYKIKLSDLINGQREMVRGANSENINIKTDSNQYTDSSMNKEFMTSTDMDINPCNDQSNVE